MKVRLIDTTRPRDREAFLRFPYELYRGCQQWVPRWLAASRLTLDRQRHPFYKHSEADFFIAEDGGKILGRIAALQNCHYNQHHKRRTGFFYYFDVVNDEKVALALLEELSGWMRARGLDEVIGPYGFLKLDGGGILVEGFEHPAAMGIAYNYPYYDSFLQRGGFVKYTDYLSGFMERGHHLSSPFLELAKKVKDRYGFHIKTFDSKTALRAWLPRIADSYESAFVGHLDYYPRTADERAWIAEEMMTVANPRLIKLVMRGDELAGFVLAFHDLREGLRRSGGKLWPFGWYYLWRAKQKQDWCNLTHVGLLPQFRNRGANALLYAELEQTLYAYNYQRAEVPLVEENNTRSIADMEAVGVRWHKRHRIYRLAL